MPFVKGQPGGPGRPKKQEKYASQIAAIEDTIADGLPDRVDKLTFLAEGGFEQVNEEWLPAALVFVDDISFDDNGKRLVTKIRAFPDANPDDLVLVKRTVSYAAPDRLANIYLIDRILGKPTQAVEGDINVSDPDQLIARFEASVDRIYGDAE